MASTRNERRRERYAQRGEDARRAHRDAALRRKYGMTADEVDALLTEQEGRCAICRTAKPGGRWGSFMVDHDHETGLVRGLLCYRCNTRIGWYENNETTINTYLNGDT